MMYYQAGYRLHLWSCASTIYNTLKKDINLLGSVTVAQDGINVALCGSLDGLSQCRDQIKSMCGALQWTVPYKTSPLFKKCLVRLKQSLLPIALPTTNHVYPRMITPEQLHDWYDKQQAFTVLDVRNQQETQHGMFANACALQTRYYRDTPKAFEYLQPLPNHQPVVAVCTGGIRCERAAHWLQERIKTPLYLLKGGILAYKNLYPEGYFKGTCFVFDERCSI
jgi:UPF0176 protein